MDVQVLRYFVGLAQHKRFSVAAREMGIAQPSLSQQIQKLEGEVGQPLFDRLPKGVVLTEAGRALLEYAVEIIEKVHDAELRMQDLSDDVEGRLSVGIIPTMAPYLLPQILRGFVKQYPQVELEVQERFTSDQLELLEQGEIDVGIMSLPIEHEHMHVETLFEEEMQLCVPSDHALARRKKVKSDDLKGERFMVLEEMHCMGQQVMQFCARSARDVHIVFTGSQIQTLQAMVSAGLGMSFIPDMGVKGDTGKGRVYVKLVDGLPRRAITAVWHLHRYRTNTMRAFMDLLRGMW